MKSTPSTILASLAGLSLVWGCSVDPDPERERMRAVDEKPVILEEEPVEAPVEEEHDSFTSSLATVRVDAVSAVPRAPRSAVTQRECDWLLPKTQSYAARQLADAGWGVTGEAPIGRYLVVSFAGLFERGTSGSCAVSRGNVGIFDGAQLLAIASVPTDKKATISHVEPLEGGSLRIWDGDIVPAPLADLTVVEGKGLVVQPVAAKQLVCNGKAEVPNIYGLPISAARKRLISKGWTAVSSGDAEGRQDMREAALAASGITEVSACSGTGFGFCRFDYRKASVSLSVTTVGEGADPSVSDYSAACS